ncbi:MAG: DUF58 domain-containing protein [Chloroflexi bacterium]|nr:MAG: DUF58 domain-containing protein [Chloroflexota bacterium]
MIRRLQLFVIGGVVLVAAFSTALPFLFYLVYLAILVIGGSYILTRLGLSDLEAGYAVSQLHGQVGDQLRVTYTLRNTSRWPKFWLEVHNPSNLPGGLHGRALSLAPRSERSWLVKVPLSRRGHFRIEPLQIRTGDPFGFFEASATVGQGIPLVVYPRIERLPLWELPPAGLEGSHAAAVRTLQTTPLATTVRPWAPGDSFNRIHWKSTARHGDIQVKEFDLEQTSDVWIFLDLDRRAHAGIGDESSLEVAVRAAASIADRALVENRAVGLTTSGHRMAVVPADRGGRQHLKIMQLLAAVEADGTTPLGEALLAGMSRLRHGMTAVVISPSLDRGWVRPLAALRGMGVACVAVILDAQSYAKHALASARVSRVAARALAASESEASATSGAAFASAASAISAGESEARTEQAQRAMRHALAEYELRADWVAAGQSLGEALVS